MAYIISFKETVQLEMSEAVRRVKHTSKHLFISQGNTCMFFMNISFHQFKR